MSGASIYGTGFGGDGPDQRSEEKETWTSTPATPDIPWTPVILGGLLLLGYFLMKGGKHE